MAVSAIALYLIILLYFIDTLKIAGRCNIVALIALNKNKMNQESP